MGPTAAIVGLWLLFAASHMALSSRGLRPRLVARLGEPAFLALYSLVALAIFVPLVWVYLESRHAGPLLWSLPGPVRSGWLLNGAMTLALVLVVAGLLQPSPASVGRDPGAAAILPAHRVTRHPLFMGLGGVGLLHLLPNGFASDVAFFAGFPLFAWVGSAHQDRRKTAEADDAFRAFVAATPFWPLASLGSWRALLALPLPVWGLGIAASFVLRWLHGPLFRA